MPAPTITSSISTNWRRVRVRVGAGGTAAELSVEDNGPGIPDAERDNALRRFHRIAGQEIDGSGLVLSIVARIAELHSARLHHEDNRPGLRVRLIFPTRRGGTPSRRADC